MKSLTDADLQAELVAHAQHRPLLDRVFPPELCDDDHAERVLRDGLARLRGGEA